MEKILTSITTIIRKTNIGGEKVKIRLTYAVNKEDEEDIAIIEKLTLCKKSNLDYYPATAIRETGRYILTREIVILRYNTLIEITSLMYELKTIYENKVKVK